MIRHVAVFRWKPDVTTQQVAEVTAALDALAAQVPSVQRYEHGPDLGLGGSFDYAVVADFDDEDGWRAYMDDPRHDAVRGELIAPLSAERGNLQLSLPK